MFSPFLLAGTALLLLGPVVVAVVHRSERGASGTAERADGWPVRGMRYRTHERTQLRPDPDHSRVAPAFGLLVPTVGEITPDADGNPVGPEGPVRRLRPRLGVPRRGSRRRHPARCLLAGV
jgi:hypothetical protein